jgi:hypothetical protein
MSAQQKRELYLFKMAVTTYWTAHYHKAEDHSMNFHAMKISDLIEISRGLSTFNV